MFSVQSRCFTPWPSPVARRQSSIGWGSASRPRRRRRFSGDGSPSLPRCTRHGLVGGRSACRVSAPVMSTKLTAPSTAMEAKGQHPSGASEALLRAVLSIPHHSHLCAASSLPESLRVLASPLMPLNPPAKRNPTDRQCPAGIELAVHWPRAAKPADHSRRLRMQIARPQVILVARAAKLTSGQG
jgi:hypothetical protein